MFLDFDKSDGLRAGENWEKRLYEEVARCHAVILVVSPAWLSSKWCFAEFSMARSLGKVVFPILLRPDDIKVIGPEISSIQTERWNEEGRTHLAERLSDIALEIARGHTFKRGRSPYPGFLSFDQQDAAVFFGRDPEIREVSERLEARRVQGGARLLMIVGPSGSGKSSVVKAGVLPWIARDPRRWVVVPPFRPGQAPVSRLSKALAEASQTPNDWKTLRARLIEAPDAALTEVAEGLQIGKSREANILITIDQFEEAFAPGENGEQDAFHAVLAAIGTGKLPMIVLATVRSDLIGDILQSQDFLITHEVYTLGKMPLERLPLVIEGPAQVAAIQLDRGLSQRIIEDAVSADALPLLAFTMREMYDRYGSAGRLTIDNYEALGDATAGLSPLENAIRRKAEETIAAAAPTAAQLGALKEAFVSGLVRVNFEGVRLRRTATLSELPEDARSLIQKLIDGRLLTARGDDSKRTVEVAHEALFRAWPQLATWLDEEQDFLVGVRHIERARQIWLAAPEGQKDKALLSGLLLEKARNWAVNYPARVTGLHDFVSASTKQEDQEKARARRRQVNLMTAAVTAAVVFAVLGVAALLQWGRAERAAELAAFEADRAHVNEAAAAAASQQAEDRFALALGAVAEGMVETDPRLALFLGSEAMSRAGGKTPGFYARRAVIRAREALAGDGPHLLASPLPVGDALSIAMAPDGETLAVGSRNGDLSLMDTSTGEPLGQPLSGSGSGIEDLEFSPDGGLLASAGSDGEVRIWHMRDRQISTGTVLGNLGSVAWSVRFDAAGKQVVASSENGLVQLWDISGSVPVARIRLETAEDMLSTVFSREGDVVLSGDGRGWIHAWDLASREEIFPTIKGIHKSDIWQLLFSPSGKQFATVSSDGSAALFEFPAGTFREFALSSEHLLYSAAFSPNGDVFIGGSEDGRLHLRYLAEADHFELSTAGHSSRISEIALSAQGTRLASLGRDQTVRIWTLLDPVPVTRDFETEGRAKGVAIGADGARVAAGDTDGRVYVWDADTARPRVFEGHGGEVWTVALSRDGTRVASGDRDGNIRVWEVDGTTPPFDLNAGDGAIWWIAFAPDGSRLFAAGDNGLAVVNIDAGPVAPDWLIRGEPLSGGAVSPDGTTVAVTGMDGDVTLLDTQTGAQLHRLHVLDDIVWAAAFNHDGTMLAVAASDEVVSLWDVDTGRLEAELGGHSGGAANVAFLSDMATVAATDRRGFLHLWDLETIRQLTPPIAAHQGASWRIAAAGVDNIFATSGDDGRVRVWDVLSTYRGCAVGAPGFDKQRRREYFGDEATTISCANE